MPAKTLSQKAADRIYKLIVSEKRFSPGEQLPGENIFSKELDISRSTLREAIQILSAQGLLEVIRGKGTFVSNDIQTLHDPAIGQSAFAHARLKDLFEMRLICEPETAALACLRATDEEMERILDLGKQVEITINEGGDRTDIDQDFHNAIVMATHNGFMQRLIPVINRSIADAISLYEGEAELADNTIQDHALIMEFFKMRDSDGARQAMLIHIRHAIHTLKLNDEEEPLLK